ncbi:hypothetical protein D1115_22600 (plasmid) [Vibrio alfacsensis]|uniref:Uncharacterized protein n=1 Tax=Vibrio alfacsensis TaxID=1074311 RepID=A0ABM6Z0P0_9VIBR|nr:hypothetical protein [Vibrio alfacsensis]AXY03677.1 hypothetical protein D1115_22600 [Vibrio alfacsensis]
MSKLLTKLRKAIIDGLDFRARMWVVHVYRGQSRGESFVVNEDSFSAPLQWMKRKGYNDSMLKQVETMKCSQILEFDLGNIQHQLMRVK